MNITIGVVHGSKRTGHLAHCLDSLAAQTVPVNVVLLYDCGTNQDPDCLRRVRFTHRMVKIHPVQYNPADGYCVSAVRNGIFAHAEGSDILAWFDSDAILQPQTAAWIAEALAKEPRGVLAMPRQRIEPAAEGDTLLPIPGRWRASDETGLRKTPEQMIDWLAEGSDTNFLRCIGGNTGCLTTRAARWDESYRGWGVEDEDWAMQMRRAGAVGVVGPVVYHQEHPVAEHKAESSARNWAIFGEKFNTHICPACGAIVSNEIPSNTGLCPLCAGEVVREELPPAEALVGVLHGSDRVESLDACLNSLREQNAACRVVVLYDATSHRDDNVVRRLASSHPEVLVEAVTYDRANGYCVSAVRNALLPHVGDERLVGWLDSDCPVAPDFIATMQATLDTTPNAVFACPRQRIHRDGRGKSFDWLPGKWRKVKGEDINRTPEQLADWLAVGQFDHDVCALCGPAYFCAREMVQPFDEGYLGWGAQDDDWNATVLRAGAKAVLGPMVFHIEHEAEGDKGDRYHQNFERLWSKFPELEPRDG